MLFKSQVSVIFVQRHVGVAGSERAHSLTGKAAVSEGELMDLTDIMHTLRVRLKQLLSAK